MNSNDGASVSPSGKTLRAHGGEGGPEREAASRGGEEEEDTHRQESGNDGSAVLL